MPSGEACRPAAVLGEFHHERACQSHEARVEAARAVVPVNLPDRWLIERRAALIACAFKRAFAVTPETRVAARSTVIRLADK